MRPLLRPGTHVLDRGDGYLQVGLDPRQAVVLPATEATRRTVELLGDSADRAEHPDQAAVDLLDAQGLLVDQGTVVPLVADTEPSPGGLPLRLDASALVRAEGDRAGEVLDERARRPVAVECFGGAAGTAARTWLGRLLTAAGLRVPTRTPGRTAERAPAVGVLVGVGEPPRERLDGWVQGSVPHLLVRLSEGFATVGPFVVPGRTACLRCLDAHATDLDPQWPLLVAQYSSRATGERRDGVPEPVDRLLASLALSWAARDVATYVDGRRPSTWSGTVRLDPHLCSLETECWLRHPECGCGWQQ